MPVATSVAQRSRHNGTEGNALSFSQSKFNEVYQKSHENIMALEFSASSSIKNMNQQNFKVNNYGSAMSGSDDQEEVVSAAILVQDSQGKKNNY